MSEIATDARVETLVANTIRKIVNENPRRTALFLINRSATDAEIGFDTGVATSGPKRGIPLLANLGNSVSFTAPDVFKGAIWAVSTGAVDITIAEESDVEESG